MASSFNTIKLNNNTLTFNGASYELLPADLSVSVTSNSDFKGVSAIDNLDGTITLNVDGNVVTVEKYAIYDYSQLMDTLTLINVPYTQNNNELIIK